MSWFFVVNLQCKISRFCIKCKRWYIAKSIKLIALLHAHVIIMCTCNWPNFNPKILFISIVNPWKFLEVQLNHCDRVYSNYWNTLLRNLKLTPYINFNVWIRPWIICALCSTIIVSLFIYKEKSFNNWYLIFMFFQILFL